MHLFEKREIDRLKSKERQQEIDQGITLARRVDSLRETAAVEESNLVKFREKTVAELHEQIKPLQEHKDVLTGEVQDLERRAKNARIPLDAEWEKLKEEKIAFSKERFKLDNRADTLTLQVEEHLRLAQDLENEKGRTANFKRTASENLVQSESTLKNAQEVAVSIRNKAQLTLVEAQLRQKDSLNREAKVAVREREVEIKQENMAKQEKDLRKREILLKDRLAMLQRTEKRKT